MNLVKSEKNGEGRGKKTCIFFPLLYNWHTVCIYCKHLSFFHLGDRGDTLLELVYETIGFPFTGRLNVVSKMLWLRLEILAHLLAVPGWPLLYTLLFCPSNRKVCCVRLITSVPACFCSDWIASNGIWSLATCVCAYRMSVVNPSSSLGIAVLEQATHEAHNLPSEINSGQLEGLKCPDLTSRLFLF